MGVEPRLERLTAVAVVRARVKNEARLEMVVNPKCNLSGSQTDQGNQQPAPPALRWLRFPCLTRPTLHSVLRKRARSSVPTSRERRVVCPDVGSGSTRIAL